MSRERASEREREGGRLHHFLILICALPRKYEKIILGHLGKYLSLAFRTMLSTMHSYHWIR